jgi:hypothetical protein
MMAGSSRAILFLLLTSLNTRPGTPRILPAFPRAGSQRRVLEAYNPGNGQGFIRVDLQSGHGAHSNRQTSATGFGVLRGILADLRWHDWPGASGLSLLHQHFWQCTRRWFLCG